MYKAVNETTTLAGGCFWCLETVFARLEGVLRTTSGYSGGHVSHPGYQAVCDGTTGHAEAVQIMFDPALIRFSEILEVFFTLHDPTTLNRQGNDVGGQYRSAVFYHGPQQKAETERVIRGFEAQEIWPGCIVTEVTPFSAFYPAEAYHQRYFEHNPLEPYCRAIIAPKIAKLRRSFAGKLKS